MPRILTFVEKVICCVRTDLQMPPILEVLHA